jgi:glycosyltransferase involved in cell wall biosynthesis
MNNNNCIQYTNSESSHIHQNTIATSSKSDGQPFFSVIIPLYNKEPHIGRALDSILAQTCSDFEIIVVDGGSTDRGPEIVRSYASQKITLIQQNNTGVPGARNQGISESNGLILAFLDADDAWLPDFLETILRLHKKFPKAGMYGTAFAYWYSVISVLNIYSKNKGEQLLECFFKDILIHDGPIFWTGSFASPKTALEAVGLYSEYMMSGGEDTDLYGKIALSYPVAYSPSICSCYYLDTVNNAFRGRLKSPTEIPLLRYLANFSENELKNRADYNDIMKYCDFLRFSFGMKNFTSGYFSCAIHQLIQGHYNINLLVKLMKYALMQVPFLKLQIRILKRLKLHKYYAKLDICK